MKVLSFLFVIQLSLSAEFIVKMEDLKAKKQLGLKGQMTALVENEFYLFNGEEKDLLIDGVEYYEPNKRYHLFKDSDFDKQWGLHNTGMNSSFEGVKGVKGRDIEALKAWKLEEGSSEIKIAVIDTGVDYTHIDLKNNILINEKEQNGKKGVDDDGNGFIDDIYGWDFVNNDNDPMDDFFHGTHCAGVIGALHNGKGVQGVMKNVKILPLKFISKFNYGSTADAIRSIDYALKRGVHIMSNSWGGSPRSQALFDMIKKAEGEGVLFVAAAGNSSQNLDLKPVYPASYKISNVMTVGATDGRGLKAGFSNYGKDTVHIFAPGVKILSTVQKGYYARFSGTSMSAPFVSGVAGLLLSQDSSLSPAELKARMMDSTRFDRDLEKFGRAGLLSAHGSLK